MIYPELDPAVIDDRGVSVASPAESAPARPESKGQQGADNADDQQDDPDNIKVEARNPASTAQIRIAPTAAKINESESPISNYPSARITLTQVSSHRLWNRNLDRRTPRRFVAPKRGADWITPPQGYARPNGSSVHDVPVLRQTSRPERRRRPIRVAQVKTPDFGEFADIVDGTRPATDGIRLVTRYAGSGAVSAGVTTNPVTPWLSSRVAFHKLPWIAMISPSAMTCPSRRSARHVRRRVARSGRRGRSGR